MSSPALQLTATRIKSNKRTLGMNTKAPSCTPYSWKQQGTLGGLKFVILVIQLNLQHLHFAKYSP